MSLRKPAKEQPEKFEFTTISLAAAKEIVSKRMMTCKSCPEFIASTSQCKRCGCFMSAKTRLKHATCPIGKWTKDL